MSLTTDVKNELCECMLPQSLTNVFRYGLLYPLGIERTSFLTDSRCVEKSFTEMFTTAIATDKVSRRNGIYHRISIIDKSLDEKYGFSNSEINREFVSGNDTDTGVFLRGVFLSCGNVSVQKAGYHLELSVHNGEKCEQLYNLIHEQGMKINRSSRRGVPFLYTKDSENISDFLTFIGAMQNSMEIMNIKIFKDFRSNINRRVNCEAANIGKTVAAAAWQIEDIKFITECGEYDKLNPELKEIAALRIENPDVSLSELGKLLDPPISRSGVNHRIEKIRRIASELREFKN